MIRSIIIHGDFMTETKEIKKNKKYEIDMCSGNLFKKIVIFCFPLMLMGILQLFYNAADLIIVSNFSDDPNALGAVGSTGSLINLTVNLFMGLSVGTNVLCANLYGSKSFERIGKVVHTSILISLIIGIALSIFGILFAKDLLLMMNNTLDSSRIYLQIYFIGMPFNLVYNFAAAILRAVGDTKRPLYYLIITGLINVILNLIFVVVFKMGVAGVALATVISQFLSFILIMTTLIKSKECYRFKFNELRISKKELFDIIKIGLPAGIQSSLFSISNTLIQSSVNKFGEVAMNGNSAAQNIEGFVYVAMNSVYHAAIAFTSQNAGARNAKNIKKITVYSLIYVTLVAATLGVAIFSIGNPIINIYTKHPDEISVAYIRLHYLCLPYFLCGIMDVMVGVIRGLGKSTAPMIVSIVGVCGLRIVWILFIFYNLTDFTNYNDLNLLYVSYPISWIVTFLAHLTCYYYYSRKIFKTYKNNHVLLPN